MMVLCVPCDRSFPTRHALDQHLQSSKHRCDLCNRFFKSVRSKRQHTQNAKNHSKQTSHHVSNTALPQISLQRHTEGSYVTPVLRNGPSGDNPIVPYTGVPRDMVTPVFKMACHLRFKNPDVDMLLRCVYTQLEASVISALIEAALRLLPPDNSPKGRAEAKEKMHQKQKQALLEETSFINQIRDFGYRFQTEKEQKEAGQRSTPDIRFLEPISVNGNLCHWIEYKNYFGFKANPFITSKNRKQYKNYVPRFGPGAVVYKLGFEVEHVSINGIEFFREAEFLYILEQQSELKGSPLG